MELSFFPLTLEAVDQAQAEALCLFIASDERPLTGLAGLCDWRLSGKLSRLLRTGLLTGDAGEAVLTPPGARMAFQKLFLFGIGPSGQGDPELIGRVTEALHKLGQAGVREAAIQLPARLSMEAGIRALLDELRGPGRAMVFGPDPQKLITVLSQAASRPPPPVQRRTPIEVPKVAPAPAAPPAPAVEPEPEREQLPLERALGSDVPKATPLPAAPISEPPIAPAVPSEPPPSLGEERKPAPPPPQRYVPPPPKPSVFEKKKNRKK
jgi:hypothetical protein